MELSEYWAAVRKYWRSVLASIIGGVLLAGIVSMLMQPTYTASTSVYVSVQNGSTASDLLQGQAYAQGQVKSFVRMATMPVVLDPVIAKLGLDTSAEALAQKVTATVPANTSIIDINVTGSDPSLTAKTATGIGLQLITIFNETTPSATDAKQPVLARVVAAAAVPTKWTSPRIALNLVVGFLTGLMIGIGQAVLRHQIAVRASAQNDASQDLPNYSRLVPEASDKDADQPHAGERLAHNDERT